MKFRQILTLASFVVPALMVGASHAAEPGLYVGAGVGQTNVDQDASDFGYTGSPDFRIDDDDIGWKAFLGYNFVPWLGVEGGYVDFGSVSQSLNANAVDADITGWNTYLVGSLPVGSVDIFAKVGGINLRTELDSNNFGSSSDNDLKLAYGVGLAYNIGHWGLRVEAEGIDDNDIDDFYFVSAGVTYRFGDDEPAPAPVVAAAPAACADSDGDGVCDTEDQCPNTPRGEHVGAMGCNCDYTLALEFAFDSAELTAGDKAKLDDIVGVLTNPKVNYIGGSIDGYTDSVGTETYNLGLSKRRAASVANYLESKGVNLGGRFSINGYGESNPVASNETSEGRAQNRRVVVSRTDCKK